AMHYHGPIILHAHTNTLTAIIISACPPLSSPLSLSLSISICICIARLSHCSLSKQPNRTPKARQETQKGAKQTK
uniref:Uncharacterized protein n=1 Tax=Aegilops tauschii subsp. strangulata TaxID=200361 RepID=A0A453JRG1_AEGTS